MAWREQAVFGNVEVTGTLDVTGAATLDGAVDINGTINVAGIATSDPSVAGQVYSNAGVLTVSAG